MSTSRKKRQILGHYIKILGHHNLQRSENVVDRVLVYDRTGCIDEDGDRISTRPYCDGRIARIFAGGSYLDFDVEDKFFVRVHSSPDTLAEYDIRRIPGQPVILYYIGPRLTGMEFTEMAPVREIRT